MLSWGELGAMAGFGIGCDISLNSLRYTGFMQEIAHSRHEDCQVLPGYRAIPKPKPAITRSGGGRCRKAARRVYSVLYFTPNHIFVPVEPVMQVISHFRLFEYSKRIPPAGLVSTIWDDSLMPL